MSREDVRKLIGGYATGTLTPEEQQALFAAALEDQELFDELAREQALRDLLREPAARAELLAALEPKPRWSWRWLLRPVALTAAAAAVTVMVVVVVRQATKPAAMIEVAQLKMPAAPPAVAMSPEEPNNVPAAAARALSRAEPKATAAAKPRVREEVSDKAADMAAAAPASAFVAPAVAPPPLAPAARRDELKQAEAVEVGAAAPSLQQVQTARGPSQAAQSQASGQALGGLPASAQKDLQAALPDARTLYYGGRSSSFAQVAHGLASQDSVATLPAVRAKTAAAPAFQAATGRATNLGVKWSILRIAPDGGSALVEPADLRAGDSIKLRFETNDSGYLWVGENQPGGPVPLIDNQRVAGTQPLETAAIRSAGAGSREFTVLFARQPQASKGAAAKAEQESAADRKERATYVVVRGDGVSQPVSFTITLNYQ